MAWHAAPSVAAGLAEATRRWPHRSTASDGTIGDAAHSARVSDHNPDSDGVVHAFDLTHDPAHGVDCARLFSLLRGNREPRIKYLIHNRRIMYGPHSDGVKSGDVKVWSIADYTGENPHTKHMHVSVGYTTSAENDTSAWWTVQTHSAPTTGGSSTKLGSRVLNEGDTGADVAFVQRFLGLDDDGSFGPATKRAVIDYQRMRGLDADGVVGPKTWANMLG